MQVVALVQEPVHARPRRTRYNRLRGHLQPTNDQQRRDHTPVGTQDGETPLAAWMRSL